MTTQVTFETLMETIGRVAAAEKITKQGLRDLSRDCLSYVIENEDVRPVNALLGMDGDGKFILTPINWRIAVQYFHHFIAFSSNYDEVKEFAIKGKGNRVPLTFTKKNKKRWDKTVEAVNAWLEDGNNDIWVWSNQAEMEVKAIDYAKKIQQAIGAALDEEKGNMTLAQVLSVIAELEDVTVYDLMAATEGLGVPETTVELETQAA